jgi:hypothetical protein
MKMPLGALSLEALVGKAYPSPEWAVFYEVSNATGFGARRRADAVALGIWPSRGHAVVGFEFKEDRGDWLKELKNPAKAESIAKHCDVWYLVAGHDKVATVEELPVPWGLYVASEDRTKLRRVKQAVPFPDRDIANMRRSFVCAMLRKVTESTVPKKELERLVREAAERERDSSHHGQELKYLQKRLEELGQVLATFKDATGVDLQHWEGTRRISAAVAAVMDARRTRDNITGALNTMKSTIRALETALAELPEPEREAS